jgi:hypothetical protein
MDEYMPIPPRVTLIRSPEDETVVRYLARTKGWKPAECRLESRGTSDDGKSDVTAVIYLPDEQAAHPGSGQSIDVYIDKASRRVTREVGAQ